MKKSFLLLFGILSCAISIKAMLKNERAKEDEECFLSVIRVIEDTDYKEYRCYSISTKDSYHHKAWVNNASACDALNSYFKFMGDKQIEYDNVHILSQSRWTEDVDQQKFQYYKEMGSRGHIFIQVESQDLKKTLKLRRLKLDYNNAKNKLSFRDKDNKEERIFLNAHCFFKPEYARANDINLINNIRKSRAIKRFLDDNEPPKTNATDQVLRNKVYFIAYISNAYRGIDRFNSFLWFNLSSGEACNKAIDYYNNNNTIWEVCVVELSKDAIESWYFDSYSEYAWRYIKKPYVFIPCILWLWYYFV